MKNMFSDGVNAGDSEFQWKFLKCWKHNINSYDVWTDSDDDTYGTLKIKNRALNRFCVVNT